MRALAPLAALLLILSACSPPPPRTTEARPQAVAVAFRATHAVHFAPGSAVLAPAERAELADFLARNRLEPGDAALVELADGAPGAQRAQSVLPLLEARGLSVVAARFPDRSPTLMRVMVERYVALAPECMPLDADTGEWTNPPLQGLGCATARNLAAMIANPRDLAVGAEPGPTDTEAATRVITLYRLGGLAQDEGAE